MKISLEITFEMEVVIFRSCLVCFYHRPLELIWPCIWSVDLSLWYGWLDMKCFVEFAQLFPSEKNFINGIYKLLASKMGEVLAAELGSRSSSNGGFPIDRALNLVGLWGRNSSSRVGTPSRDALIAENFDCQWANREGTRRLVLALTSPTGDTFTTECTGIWSELVIWIRIHCISLQEN